MLNVKVTGLLRISMLPVASSCNLSSVIANLYANIKKRAQGAQSPSYYVNDFRELATLNKFDF